MFRKAMDTRKSISLMFALLFLGVSSPAEACKCMRGHLQSYYCNSEAVLKIEFLNEAGSPDDSSSIGYNIKMLQVFKGGADLQSKSFISSMGGTSCEYHHNPDDFNTPYLITGSISNGHVSVSGCSFIKPWSSLSAKQIEGINGAYLEGCSCQIFPCSYQPCNPPNNNCLFEMYENGDSVNQDQNQKCVKNQNGSCTWKTIE